MSNTNILLAGRSPDLITPAEAMQQAANANNALAQGAMRSMQAQQLGQQMRDDAEINTLMERNGGDLNRAMQDPNLNWRAKQQIGGMIADQDSARAKAESAKVDSEIKKWQYAGNTIGNTQSQEQYDAARQHLRGVVGDMVDHLPQQWSPEVANQYGGMAMTHAEKLALQREERQANYQNQSLALQERRLQAAENRGSGMDAQDKGWEVKESSGGLVRVNKYTGEVAPITMGGQAVQGKPAGGGNASDDERKAAGWASQMELAKSQIGDVLAKTNQLQIKVFLSRSPQANCYLGRQ